MPVAPRAQLFFASLLLSSLLLPSALYGQKPAPPVPAPKNPPVGPPAPQSKHYPILLLAFGNEPNWSVRIGLKGPERFDRAGYPPIPLEPAEVTYETAADTWTYHAKDSATGAAVAVHLSREACTDALNDTLTTTPPLGGKYSFRASIDHAQIGSLKGCARVATELFPKINNQPSEDADEANKKPPVPVSTVTKFQMPVAVAYLNAAQQLVFKRGSIVRIIPGKSGYDLTPSHDGKKLLFTRDEGPGPIRTINEYDYDSNSVRELLRGSVRNAVWSSDDSRIAFLTYQQAKWQLWTFPSTDATKVTVLAADSFDSIQGWADPHTLLVTTLNQADLAWVGEDGKPSQTLAIKDLCGPDFLPGNNLSIRMHPSNADLVVVSAVFAHPPQGMPLVEKQQEGDALFLYEFRARRRVLLSTPNLAPSSPEWSRDGFQIFFTGTDASKRTATYRIFWDGIGLKKYLSGTALVIGQ